MTARVFDDADEFLAIIPHFAPMFTRSNQWISNQFVAFAKYQYVKGCRFVHEGWLSIRIEYENAVVNLLASWPQTAAEFEEHALAIWQCQTQIQILIPNINHALLQTYTMTALTQETFLDDC